MKAVTQQSETEQEAMASRIVELSNDVLSTGKTKSGYIPLKIASGPYSNVFAVRKNRISCFIRSTELLSRVRAEGFNPEEAPKTVPMNEHKFYFWGLGLDDIHSHESLFREVVQESVRTIMDRRPKKK
jgi:hypothetical protein